MLSAGELLPPRGLAPPPRRGWGAHLLLEIGAAAQAGKEEKQETGSLGSGAQCHHAFCPAVQSKDSCWCLGAGPGPFYGTSGRRVT